MKRRWVRAAAAFVLFVLAGLLAGSRVRAGETPVIALTRVPAWGEADPFEGFVFLEGGGDFDPAGLRVSLFVELVEWHTFWPKPDLDHPTVPLTAEAGDGRAAFTVSCDTRLESDRTARRLHLLLVPADYVPTRDFKAAEAAALDHVVVERTPEGEVRVTPHRTLPAGWQTCLSGEKPALDVGFYRRGAPGEGLSREEIREVLRAVLPFAGAVRFYAASGELAPAYEEAALLGIPVIGSAWLCGDADRDREELDALAEHCREGRCVLACVGSETLLRGDLSPEELLADMDYVRAGLAGTGIPVATAEDAGKLLEHREVADACDILMPNIHPYWADSLPGRGACQAAGYLAGTAGLLSRAFPEKEIIVSETGWPTAGEACASPPEAVCYFAAAMAWSREAGIPVLWFAACDEPWKRMTEGEAGAHWGILDENLEMKPCYAQLPFFTGLME